MSGEPPIFEEKILNENSDSKFSEENLDDENFDPTAEDFAKESLLDISEMEQKQVQTLHPTTYKWNGKKYPIMPKETVAHLARRVINHNLDNGYTLGVYIGHSGTGKTTGVTTLAHRMHKIASERKVEYAVNWFEKMDIARIDEIIKGLEKGVNRIMIIDDASYGDRELTEQQSEELMANLTYVRHTLKANVIFLLIMHYSKALGPFLRDGDFAVITSITPVERENYIKMYGPDSKWIIKKFFTKYGSMNAEGYYYSNLNENTVLTYYSKRPFKLALVNDFGELHFMNYPAETCGHCRKLLKEKLTESEIAATEKDLFKRLVDSYGITRLRQCCRWYFRLRGGANTLDPLTKATLNRLIEYYDSNPKDYESLLAELKANKSVDRVLRKRGVIKIPETNEEKAANRRANKAADKRKRDEMARAMTQVGSGSPVDDTGSYSATQEGLDVAGVHSINPGPMNDEEVIASGNEEPFTDISNNNDSAPSDAFANNDEDNYTAEDYDKDQGDMVN